MPCHETAELGIASRQASRLGTGVSALSFWTVGQMRCGLWREHNCDRQKQCGGADWLPPRGFGWRL